MSTDRAAVRTAPVVECPYCYVPLAPYSVHSCDWMEATILPRATRVRWDRVAQVVSYAVAFFAAVYLTAHVLVANGVACP